MASDFRLIKMCIVLTVLLLIMAVVYSQESSSEEGEGVFGSPVQELLDQQSETEASIQAALTQEPPFAPEPEYTTENDGDSGELTTTAPSPADVANFTILGRDGNACIRACFSAVFNILYSNKQKEKVEAKVPLPSKAKASGSCGSAGIPAQLTIQWNERKYNLKFTFENTTDHGKACWKARRVQFTYNISDALYFKDAAGAGLQTVHSGEDDYFFKTPAEKSRKCDAEDDIKLVGSGSNDTGKVMLELRNLQLQPYNLIDDSFSEAELCENDKGGEGTNMASIIVGATLALIILFVIVGYAIGRRMGAITDRTSYSSMD